MEHKEKRNDFKVIINDRIYVIHKMVVTGKELLVLSDNTPPECFSLYQKFKKGDFEKIDLNEKVDLSKKGIERFVVKPPEFFNYFIDDEPETTDQKELTPNQILELAGILPVKDYYLIQILEDGSQESYQNRAEIPIQMTCPALKFISIFVGEMVVA